MSKADQLRERNSQIKEQRARARDSLKGLFPDWDFEYTDILFLPGHTREVKIKSVKYQHHIHHGRHLYYKAKTLAKYKGPFPVITIEIDQGITIIARDPVNGNPLELFLFWHQVRLDDLHFYGFQPSQEKSTRKAGFKILGGETLPDKSVR
ncbi:MAG: hypothetical protein KDD43_00230 [Bdellovibrionales bacterium]|nr:hypothetical protein [Bdellovibrionales bacterium]